MTILRLYAAIFLIVLTVYTGIVMANYGPTLVPIFFDDMASMNWPGQFNLDFMGFLILSTLWVLWRHEFSGVGWALAPFALFGGMIFLTVYLLVMSFRVADLKTLLIGERRARP